MNNFNTLIFVWFHWRKADLLTLTSEISFLSLSTLVRSSLAVLSWFSCCLLSCEWICSSSRLHADSEASVVRSRVSKSCMVDSLSDTVCVRRVNSDCTCACSDYNMETWKASDEYHNIALAKEHFLGWTEEGLNIRWSSQRMPGCLSLCIRQRQSNFS